jgi:hypothetical protein
MDTTDKKIEKHRLAAVLRDVEVTGNKTETSRFAVFCSGLLLRDGNHFNRVVNSKPCLVPHGDRETLTAVDPQLISCRIWSRPP